MEKEKRSLTVMVTEDERLAIFSLLAKLREEKPCICCGQSVAVWAKICPSCGLNFMAG